MSNFYNGCKCPQAGPAHGGRIALPGAVGSGDGSGSVSAEEQPADKGDQGADGGAAVGAAGSDVPGGASQSDATSAAGEAARFGGDFARGKRLRKLLRLINNRVTLQTLSSFQRRMLGLAMGVLLLHIAAFVAVMITLSSNETWVSELDAAGTCCARLGERFHRMHAAAEDWCLRRCRVPAGFSCACVLACLAAKLLLTCC